MALSLVQNMAWTRRLPARSVPFVCRCGSRRGGAIQVPVRGKPPRSVGRPEWAQSDGESDSADTRWPIVCQGSSRTRTWDRSIPGSRQSHHASGDALFGRNVSGGCSKIDLREAVPVNDGRVRAFEGARNHAGGGFLQTCGPGHPVCYGVLPSVAGSANSHADMQQSMANPPG